MVQQPLSLGSGAGPNPDLALPTDLTQEILLAKCEYFASIGIWPKKDILDPELWLRNFLADEVEHALYLLNAFMYFSTDLVDQIFSTSIRTVGRLMTKSQWTDFLDKAIVTMVTGEVPSITDSGHVFARKARALSIPEERIKTPEKAFYEIQRNFSGALFFVDDFVGSGNQFIDTWHRKFPFSNGSFSDIAAASSTTFYYCPAFCTELGLENIKKACPKVEVNPGVLIPQNYSALASDSILWPTRLQSTAVDFLLSASRRAGIPDTGGNEPEDWRGFASLGLTIAMEKSVPDATLPIIYWDKNGWLPLMRRNA